MSEGETPRYDAAGGSSCRPGLRVGTCRGSLCWPLRHSGRDVLGFGVCQGILSVFRADNGSGAFSGSMGSCFVDPYQAFPCRGAQGRFIFFCPPTGVGVSLLSGFSAGKTVVLPTATCPHKMGIINHKSYYTTRCSFARGLNLFFSSYGSFF